MTTPTDIAWTITKSKTDEEEVVRTKLKAFADSRFIFVLSREIPLNENARIEHKNSRAFNCYKDAALLVKMFYDNKMPLDDIEECDDAIPDMWDLVDS